jgi:hypothetical protein
MKQQKNDANRTIELDSVFSAISEPLKSILATTSATVSHPTTKGDASEYQWLMWLRTYLPKRYEVDKGFVIDSEGGISDQQDIVVYDRQYTPYLLNKDGIIYVPAESVYAVIEVKQKLNKEYIRYTGEKIASVRRLKRTSVSIPHAGGKFKPKTPCKIIGGLVCLESGWKKGINDYRVKIALNQNKEEKSQIDMICCLSSGSLTAVYKKNKIELRKSTADGSLVFFFISLLTALQSVATVAAMDYSAYAKTLKSFNLRE